MFCDCRAHRSCDYRRVAYVINPIYTRSTATITVERSERVCSSSSKGSSTDCKYLIWSRQGEVFQDVDVWYFFKWNSSDVVGRLRNGHTYHVTVSGWRVPFFSWYRNIVSVDAETS